MQPTAALEVEVVVRCVEEQKHPVRLRVVSWEQWEMAYTPCETLLGRAFSLMVPCGHYVREKRDELKQDVIRQLSQAGAPAVSVLIEALEDKHWLVRLEAIRALGQVGDASAVPALCDLLERDVEYVGLEAAIVLGQLGDTSAVPTLCKALGSRSVDLRHAAAKALGQIRDTSATQRLIEALRDREPAVRIAACEALGRIGDDTAIPALERALEDSYRDPWGYESYPVRMAACEALSQMGKSAVSALVRALDSACVEVRLGALCALDRIGDPQAIPALRIHCISLWPEDFPPGSINADRMSLLVDSVGALLAQPTWWPALKTALPNGLIRAAVVQQSTIAIPMLIETFEHRDTNVRAAACQALGEIGAPAVPALIEVLEDEERVLCGRYIERACACQALGLIGVTDAIPILLEALRDRHAEVRAAACTALGQIGDAQAVPALCRALEDEEWQVRRSACEALGLIGDTNPVPALIRVLGDVDETVRAAACWALGRIGDINAAPALRIHADYLSEARIALYCLDALETPLEEAVGMALKQPQWWGVLIRALPEERIVCAIKASHEAILPLLILAAKDSCAYVRRVACEILGEIGDAAAVPVLTQALRDANPEVRRVAVEALEQINPPDTSAHP